VQSFDGNNNSTPTSLVHQDPGLSLRFFVDSIVPVDGSAESAGTAIYILGLIEERRKKLFPDIRKIIAHYDCHASEGNITLNIASAAIRSDR
jgi:hypothetical protein